MTALQPVRGTRDLIGEDFRRHHAVAETARRTSALYGFEEWATPVFEDTRVFARGLGDSSDVVMKEMYSFQDRGGDNAQSKGLDKLCTAVFSGVPVEQFTLQVLGEDIRETRHQKHRIDEGSFLGHL